MADETNEDSEVRRALDAVEVVNGLRRIRHTMATKWDEYGVDVLDRAIGMLEPLTSLRKDGPTKDVAP